MDFGDAIRALKAGKCVRRAGWNGKNMHIYLEDQLSYEIPNVKAAGIFRVQRREYGPCICMFNAQGKHQPGWLANQPDILSEDWEIVPYEELSK
jgi:hypothetical protein